MNRPLPWRAERETVRSYVYCRRLTRARARNFYPAFFFLPREKRWALYAVYAFCFLCDEVADGDLPPHEKAAWFARMEEALSRLGEGQGGGLLLPALTDAVARFGISTEHLREILVGCRDDLEHEPFRTTDQLLRYCYQVSSAVGLVCLPVFGTDDLARARGPAVELGYAMQLTNILRDLAEDAGRKRIYLPAEEIDRFGVSREAILAGRLDDSFRRMMAFQVDRVRDYFQRASALLPLVDRDARLFPMALASFYRRILDKIESSGYDVFSRRRNLSVAEKLAVAGRLWSRKIVSDITGGRRPTARTSGGGQSEVAGARRDSFTPK